MDKFEYVLLDRATANFLGEWHTYEEAEETYLSYIRAAPEAFEHLRRSALSLRRRRGATRVAA